MSTSRILLASALLSACAGKPAASNDESPPEFVYVRTPAVTVSLEIHAPAEAATGEWIVLTAARDVSGEWRKVKYSDVSAETPWLAAPIAGRQDDVAASLLWLTDPPRPREFDVPGRTSGASSRNRLVRFNAPGVYKIWAQSYRPLDAKSNVLTITVR